MVLTDKEQSVEELDKEVSEKLESIKKKDIIDALIASKVKHGKIFKSPEEARLWAEDLIAKKLLKHRLRHGLAIECSICRKPGSNVTSGPFIKIKKDIYAHRNCI